MKIEHIQYKGKECIKVQATDYCGLDMKYQ